MRSVRGRRSATVVVSCGAVLGAAVVGTGCDGGQMPAGPAAGQEAPAAAVAEQEAPPNGDAIGSASPTESNALPEPVRTFVFACSDDVDFIVRTGPEEIALWTPDELGTEYHVLPRARAASGALYQDGETLFWNHGELATFEVGRQRFVDCRLDPAAAPWADAARRGVTFRALGHEPEWALEITPERSFVLISDLGQSRLELPYRAPTSEAGQTIYRSVLDGRAATIVIEPSTCTDSMSGELFDASVTLTLDNESFIGCGRYLQPLR